MAYSCHNGYMKMPVYNLALLVGNRITATEVRRLLNAARDFLEAQPEESYVKADYQLDRGLREIAAQNNVTPEELFRPLRVALAGQLASPALFEMTRSVGKQETRSRVERALRSLSDQATR